MQAAPVASSLTSFELHLHGEGTHHESYRMLGSHLVREAGLKGVRFAVWAPNARRSGNRQFSGWNRAAIPCSIAMAAFGIVHPGAGRASTTRLRVSRSEMQEKSDPYAFFAEAPPRTASIVWD